MEKSPKLYQVVLDTSVLVAGLRSRRGASFALLELIGDSRWRMNVSPALLFEYEELARREAAQFWAEPDKVEAVIDFICANANKPRISYLWRPFLQDPDDEMLLELAVAARADFIVTHNVRDFQGAEKFGIGILTPGGFLKKLRQSQ